MSGLLCLRICILFGVMLSATACRYLAPGTQITAEVVEGAKFCSVVRIPRDWESVNRSYWTSLTLLYRKPSGDSGILFSANDPRSGHDIAVAEKYRLDPEHRTISTATDADWEAGKELGFMVGSPEARLDETQPGSVVQKNGMITRDRRDTLLRGRRLTHSGDIDFDNYMAPGDRFIALGSFNGYSAQGRFALADSFFVDVYDVNSGKRLAQIKGFWKQWSPDAILHQMSWLSDRDLVLPFGVDTRDMVVCRF